ncbi:MAG: sugar phosphate isomerase/epimerase [Flavisolibacter sp.]|nr:sugar phosphate isomerase/epimerase [Flavisolibacter sp.]
MKIKFFCPRWGFENIPWETFLSDVKMAGFSGIEWFPYSKKEDYPEVVRLMKSYQLEFCIVMAVTEHHDSLENYLSALKYQLLDLCSIRNGDWAPLHISAQTGREYFTEPQIEDCLECCASVSRQTGIPIYQETHRNKWAYAAHRVYPFLEKHPDLHLTLDISHWFCVSESYLADQQPAVQKAIQHALHIHARVGHTEGPQVWEPAAPEYAEALEAHLKIWDKWIDTRIKDGATHCTITPEFGPPPYMVFANRGGSPQQEQWRLNNWMKSLLEKRYREI